ncbi:MAG TPA: hypothetical protein VE338_09500 [Ktedonobacterales bacterium]|nr:hypothetical protein [Ktedonobacterales bacterium]
MILLALVALLGLLMGFLTHTLLSRGAITARINPTSTTLPHATSSQKNTPVPSAGATATATTRSVTGQFQLSVTVAPKTMTAGQQITITVQAFTPDTHTPVAGVTCQLRAPTDRSPGLFSSWPAPQTTDSSGSVTWTLTAPQESPGSYTVEAFGKSSSWGFKMDSSVQLRAG